MGRFSSTGVPFLVERVDAGQFTYHRDLPARLVPLAKGDILLPCSGRTRTLAGKKTVKISIGTGMKSSLGNAGASSTLTSTR